MTRRIPNHASLALVIVCLFVSTYPADAREWVVKPGSTNPEHFESIHEVLELEPPGEVLSPGDSIAVHWHSAGYNEPALELDVPQVHLYGIDGPDGMPPVVSRDYQESDLDPILEISAESTVSNLCFRYNQIIPGDHLDPDYNIGVLITGAARLEDCTVTHCNAGVVISRYTAQESWKRAVVRGCTIGCVLQVGQDLIPQPNRIGILHKEPPLLSGETLVGRADRIEHNQIRHNSRLGIYLTAGSRAEIHNNLIVSNGETGESLVGGIHSFFLRPTAPVQSLVQAPIITGNTIDDNEGFGIRFECRPAVLVSDLAHTGLVRDNIITNNTGCAIQWAQDLEPGTGLPPLVVVVRQNLIHGNADMFCDPPPGWPRPLGITVNQPPDFDDYEFEGWDDYYLRSDPESSSPAIDAGSYRLEPGTLLAYEFLSQGLDDGWLDVGYHYPGYHVPEEVPWISVGSLNGYPLLQWGIPTVYADGSVLDDLVGYQVEVGTDPEKPSLVKKLEKVTQFLLEGLAPGKTYYATVTAFNSKGVLGEKRTVKIALE